VRILILRRERSGGHDEEAEKGTEHGGRRVRAEGRKQRAESREQKAESRKQRAESRDCWEAGSSELL
jgi:hypothetical protein